MSISSSLESFLAEFISFQSIDGNNTEKQNCADWLVETFFSDKDITQEAVQDCPYIYRHHPDAKFLFFAHFDVVPAPEDLYTLKIEDGIAKGRGVKDMKGAQLPFLMALNDCAPGAPVSVLLTSDEETAGQTIPLLLDEEIVPKPEVAYTPDSSGSKLVFEHKGVVWGTLTAKGKGGHAAMPWKSANPVQVLASVLAELEKKFPYTDDYWGLTVTPTCLHQGGANNQICETAACNLDIRFTPECGNADDVIGAINSLLPNNCEFEVVTKTAGLCTNQEHPFIQGFTKLLAEEIKDPGVFREHGATDARYFGERGIPAFLFGPEGGGLHADDEWVSMKSLEQHYYFYCALLESL